MDLTFSPKDYPDTTEQKMLNGNSLIGKEANLQRGAMSTSDSFSQINSTIMDPATELTEDDIFRMKNLRLSAKSGIAGESIAAEIGDQFSAVSVVDSTSNFGEREKDIPYDDTEDESEPDNEGEERVYQDYAFGRKRAVSPKLNKDTVSTLYYPFVPSFTPPGENPEEYAKAFTDAKVYLVGTAHFSQQSKRDVMEAILAVQPDVVMVELCSSRIGILSMDEKQLLREAKKLNRKTVMEILRSNGIMQGLLHILLLATSVHITKQLGMAPGGEFRAAHEASLKVRNCRMILGDRPIQVTLQRALNSLGFFQQLWSLVRILFSSTDFQMTEEDVERFKDKDMLEAALSELAGEFPQLTRIFVEERDEYMTHILRVTLLQSTVEKWIAAKALSVPFEPVVAVAVVGIGHTAGITANWNRDINSAELLTVPEPSRVSRLVGFTFRILFWGGTAYVCYRAGRFSANKLATAVAKAVK